MGDPLGAKLRLFDVLQDTSRIGQKQFSRRVQSNSSRQSVEKGKSHFLFQVPNLARQRRLRDLKPLRRTPEMLVFSDADKVA